MSGGWKSRRLQQLEFKVTQKNQVNAKKSRLYQPIYFAYVFLLMLPQEYSLIQVFT